MNLFVAIAVLNVPQTKQAKHMTILHQIPPLQNSFQQLSTVTVRVSYYCTLCLNKKITLFIFVITSQL